MAYLCISRNRSSEKTVILQEGEVYEIDQYTTKFFDSDKLREKNKLKTTEYQRAYPDGKNGGIRLFVQKGEEIVEHPVLYKKQLTAVKEIIKNTDFMAYYAQNIIRREYARGYEATGTGRRYSTLVLNRIINKRKVAHTNEYVKHLKEQDNCKTGGKKYFEFVREVIQHYKAYITAKPYLPSIDEIINEHISKLKNIALQKGDKKEKKVLPEPIFEFVDDQVVFGNFVDYSEEETGKNR